MMVFLPHYGAAGGAGKYINHLAAEFKNKGVKIFFGGRYKNEYNYSCLKLGSRFEWLLSLFVLPSYVGVKRIPRALYLLRMFFLAPIAFLCRPEINLAERKCDFVLTSIIQTPQIIFLKYLYPSSRVVILVQENFFSEGLYGWLSVCFLKKADVIVCIDSFSLAKLSKHGLDPVLVLNKFEQIDMDDAQHERGTYDAIYVGGDNEIKGFSLLLEFFCLVSESADVNILMLGCYSERSKSLMDRINSRVKGSSLKLIGQVDSCAPYYLKSSILLLPISSPHFCRPAIEAGLLGKTFLISDFDGLDDFSKPGFNCKVFTAGDVNSFSESFLDLFRNDGELEVLQRNNYLFSSSFRSKFSVGALFERLGY